jgi:heme A synthase
MKWLSFSETEAYMINPIELRGVKMKKEYIKPFAWGMAVGMVVLLIVVFSAGWVVTSNSAKAMAQVISSKAMVDRLAPISVAQFLQDPNRVARLAELKKLDSWERADFVKQQGWSIMPGEKESDYNVANECARLLVELEM